MYLLEDSASSQVGNEHKLSKNSKETDAVRDMGICVPDFMRTLVQCQGTVDVTDAKNGNPGYHRFSLNHKKSSE